ncbi:MAG: nascent polypeptide-associated complex protein [Candidatus Woesearchaeota archaeon]
MNPRNMKKMMKRMGIQPNEIDAKEVRIILNNGKEILITNTNVMKVNMMGQETYQITGDSQEIESEPEEMFDDEDIEMIMDQTGCSKEEAQEALEETEDIAEAIVKLSD